MELLLLFDLMIEADIKEIYEFLFLFVMNVDYMLVTYF